MRWKKNYSTLKIANLAEIHAKITKHLHLRKICKITIEKTFVAKNHKSCKNSPLKSRNVLTSEKFAKKM